MYAFMCVCVYLFMYVCMFVCMHVCMYECMYVYMYVCVYVCMYENTKKYHSLNLYEKKTLIDKRLVTEQEAIEKINSHFVLVTPNVVKSPAKPSTPKTSRK